MNEDHRPSSDGPQTQRWLVTPDDPRLQRAARLFSLLVTAGIVAAVVWYLGTIDPGALLAMLPHSPWFWAIFAITYMTGPVGDWFIFRRLWGLSAAGLAPLIRKMVSNELLLGYLGDAQFYGWARANLSQVAAPFGAVKDVAILSAVTGNLMTLALLGAAWPLVASGQLGVATRDAYVSLGVVLVSSFAILVFRRSLFSLPQSDLWFISAVHVGRTAVYLIGSAAMWHLVLESVAISLWFVLATLRMLVSRLPLLPNKDLVFAGLTVFLLGNQPQVAGLMALMTLLMLVAHMIMGSIFGIADMLDTEKAK